ncbi:MAG TPA: YdeI/OmpD-associated family protein [Thermoanaerobaculia bacterium]
MGDRIPQVDAYIEAAAPFAQPILKAVRDAYHDACPEVVESIKWGFPHFEYKGLLGNMAAFRKHATLGFWKAGLMNDPHGLLRGPGSMTSSKLTDVSQLPDRASLADYVRDAVRLNEEKVKLSRPPRKAPVALEVPTDLQAALEANAAAGTTFANFFPSHRREYIEWINEAKQQATRERRLATTIEWLAEGKAMNWKYKSGRGTGKNGG